ncbi:magnesium/cobalt transporter CorA [Patescibacteria group bacterium]|nr:magnesium/cobalt transporter CorA [Patescibacteria group bacterium]
MKKSKNFQEIKTTQVCWLNFTSPTAKDLEYLRNNFNFHPLDIEDCLSPAQRPKLDEYPDYLFIILTFPYYLKEERQIESSEVGIFIGPNYLVTVTDGKLIPLNNFFEQCQFNDTFREKYLSEGPSQLLYHILNKLQLYCYPMLDHISEDIQNIEKVIFSGYERKMVKEILIVKQNIVSFRKTMQSHRNVIRKFIAKRDKFFIPNAVTIYFANILEQTKDLWDIMESVKENIEALHETNESLISFRLNDIMKILTTISVILLPISLIASIFGMNTPLMPFIYLPYGFWIILGMMGVLALLLIWFFKKRGWL